MGILKCRIGFVADVRAAYHRAETVLAPLDRLLQHQHQSAGSNGNGQGRSEYTLQAS